MCLFFVLLITLAVTTTNTNAIKLDTTKKTVVITGASSGVGLAATKILASNNNWNVIMACRRPEKAESAKSTITTGINNVQILPLDLADLKSVKAFSSLLDNTPIDVLVCNAGVQESTTGLGGKESQAIVKRTVDGFETTIGTNHIGHFLLLKQLLNNVKKSTTGGRIVILGSGVHDPESPGGKVGSKATLGDMSGLRAGFQAPISMVDSSDYDPDKAYKDSKLCNVMTSFQLARRLQAEKSNVTCNVMNPGLIPTSGLFRSINPIFVFFFTLLTRYVFRVAVSEEEGGRCVAYMVESQLMKGVTGGYFSAEPGPSGKSFGPVVASTEARDESKAIQLWELTEKLVSSR